MADLTVCAKVGNEAAFSTRLTTEELGGFEPGFEANNRKSTGAVVILRSVNFAMTVPQTIARVKTVKLIHALTDHHLSSYLFFVLCEHAIHFLNQSVQHFRIALPLGLLPKTTPAPGLLEL